MDDQLFFPLTDFILPIGLQAPSGGYTYVFVLFSAGEGTEASAAGVTATQKADGGESHGESLPAGSSSDQDQSSARDSGDAASDEGRADSPEEVPAAGSLFLKRSADEDLVNNNEHRAAGGSRDEDRGSDDDEGKAESDEDAKRRPESKDNDDKLGMFPTSLLNMNMPALGAGSPTSGSNNPADQLKTIAQTISQLTANVANNSNPKTVQELAVLQATLFSLQQQQLLQMQILTQMQMTQKKDEDKESIADLAKKMEMQNSLASPKIPHDDADATPLPPSLPSKTTLANLAALGPAIPPPITPPESSPSPKAETKKIETPPKKDQIMDPNSSTLASDIIMHHDAPDDKPAVNSLELLQQKAQGILNNASQGLLANNLADFTCGKDQRETYEKKGEPFFKHRCRYCGKVFGSDSALQIHVRSHTGERPYKCNVCGNRFTTKGNLKVHFQRHTHKFPHVKMNPNLVPEHLDKFYPSLLQQIEEAEKKGLPMPNINNPMAGMTPVIPPGFRLPNIPGLPPQSAAAAAVNQLFAGSSGSSGPSSLLGGPGLPGGPPIPRFPMPPSSKAGLVIPTSPFGLDFVRDSIPRDLTKSPPSRKHVLSSFSPKSDDNINVTDEESKPPVKRIKHDSGDTLDTKSELKREENSEDQDEPQNLSKTAASFNLLRGRSISPGSNREAAKAVPSSSPNPGGRSPGTPFDPAKDPEIYSSLLPRPGSNDNAWESLIEVARTSETSKLEQLVNNIEDKLNDPNECFICHRVLSCKSALQMHYRTHTGERPFKCRICSRAFTTKGNLKTHMGVHRAKPPMRMFHQCPVCHKKYANALVLQQHIRTHTGEPTDLTAEQIAAAEIRDFPPFPSGCSGRLFPVQFPPGLGVDGGSPDSDDRKDESRPSSVSSSTSSTLNIPTSIPASTLASLEQLARTTDSAPHQRPFGLVRPFFSAGDRPLPEDLSRKDSPPVSPPKFSPEPPSVPSPDRSRLNGKSPGLVSSPDLSQAAKAAAAAAAMDPRGSAAAAAAAAAAASSLLFPGLPGLIPPGASFPNPLLAAAAGPPPPPLSQLNSSSLTGPAFNPLGLPFPSGVPGTRRKSKCGYFSLKLLSRSLVAYC